MENDTYKGSLVNDLVDFYSSKRNDGYDSDTSLDEAFNNYSTELDEIEENIHCEHDT